LVCSWALSLHQPGDLETLIDLPLDGNLNLTDQWLIFLTATMEEFVSERAAVRGLEIENAQRDQEIREQDFERLLPSLASNPPLCDSSLYFVFQPNDHKLIGWFVQSDFLKELIGRLIASVFSASIALETGAAVLLSISSHSRRNSRLPSLSNSKADSNRQGRTSARLPVIPIALTESTEPARPDTAIINLWSDSDCERPCDGCLPSCDHTFTYHTCEITDDRRIFLGSRHCEHDRVYTSHFPDVKQTSASSLSLKKFRRTEQSR
jgi:hypothetical protein